MAVEARFASRRRLHVERGPAGAGGLSGQRNRIVVAVADDRGPLAVRHLGDDGGAERVAQVGIVVVGELPQDDLRGIGLAVDRRIGDVEGVQALAAGVQAADEHCIPAARAAPSRGRIDEGVRRRRVAVHQIQVRAGVVVRLTGELGEVAVDRARHVGEQLGAGCDGRGVERVQHAVVRSDIDHRPAAQVSGAKRDIRPVEEELRRRAHEVRRRVDDVAQFRVGPAPEQGRGRAFTNRVAAQVLQAQVALERATRGRRQGRAYGAARSAVRGACRVGVERRALRRIVDTVATNRSLRAVAERNAIVATAGLAQVVGDDIALIEGRQQHRGVPDRCRLIDVARGVDAQREQLAAPVVAVELRLIDGGACLQLRRVGGDRGCRRGREDGDEGAVQGRFEGQRIGDEIVVVGRAVGARASVGF